MLLKKCLRRKGNQKKIHRYKFNFKFLLIATLLYSFQEDEENVDGSVFVTQESDVNLNGSFFFSYKFLPIYLLCLMLNFLFVVVGRVTQTICRNLCGQT